jgi:transcription initiation factor TFIIH subunit 4
MAHARLPERTKSSKNPLQHNILSDFARWASEAPNRLDELYHSPHAVQCMLRALPPIARLYVARVLYLPEAAPAFSPAKFRDALLRRQRARDRHDAALAALRALRVFVSATSDRGEDFGAAHAGAMLMLNPPFARQMRLAITCQVPPVFTGPLDARRDLKELDIFSAHQLEQILNYPIGTDDGGKGQPVSVPGVEIQTALASTGILDYCDGGRSMKITSIGFQFLLMDSFTQVWVLLRNVINQSFKGSEFEALDFVFQLSFASCGRGYPIHALLPVQRKLLSCLHELGILSIEEEMGRFYPTSLGVSLVSATSHTEADSVTAKTLGPSLSTSGDIQIIVETNFRLYAYTTSAFQTNLLRLFTHMRYRLPNLVVGHLTRDAVREALMIGIKADQIIGYLNAHGHPRMKNGMIPSTVRDEIKLWEAEQERVQMKRSFLLREFRSAEQFERVLQYARDVSGCLWSHTPRRQIVVSTDEYDRIRSFIKSVND